MYRKRWILLISFIVISLLVVGIGLAVRFQKNTAQAGVYEPIILPWTTPPDYRVVYLVSDRAALEQSMVAPSRLEEILGVRTVTSWKEVIEQDRQGPIDALIIHNSAISAVDKTWVKKAYRKGAVIAVFNVYAPALAELLDVPGIAQGGFASEPYPGDFFIVVSRLILGKPEDVARAQEALDAGIEEPAVPAGNHLTSTWGRSQDQLIYEDSLNRFALVLVSHLEDIQRTKEEYENKLDLDSP